MVAGGAADDANAPARPSITIEDMSAPPEPAPAPEPVAAPTSTMTDEQLQRDLPGFEEDAPPALPPKFASTHADDDGVVVERRNLGQVAENNSHKLVAETSMHPDAGTSASVYTSFLIDGEWTEPVLFFAGAKQGEVKVKEFDHWNSKGTSIRFSIKSPEGCALI